MKIAMRGGGQPAVKIEYYRPKIDSLKHPVVPRKGTAHCKLDAD